jgi:DNA-binding HxlR family transcriptional regulator
MESQIAFASPAEEVVRTLGVAHSVAILMALHDGGPVGFLRLQRRMDNLHHTAITRALRRLEKNAFIERTPGPSSVIYDLSDRGRSLVPALRLIEAVAQRDSDPETARTPTSSLPTGGGARHRPP